MVIVPPSFATGALFGIELLGTDWESEGFAVGDILDMAMGPITSNSVFLNAVIRGINGPIATFNINTVYFIAGSLNTQAPFPLVAFLVNDRLTAKAALLRAGDIGFTSTLNGQPFSIPGHANSLNIDIYGPSVQSSQYNLRLYDASQESVISSIMPNCRNLRSITVELNGSQFYAYRSSLDPTANTPTQAYPTRGKILLECEAPNQLRNISFEAECILLHANRLGETTNFISPGTLTISSGSGTISAPSVPSPVRQAICLIGPDSHHSLPNIISSIDLTRPTAPPNLPSPRQGADYVGVVTGQVGGEWVAVMTNKVSSTPPTYNLQVITENLQITRYDAAILYTTDQSARLPGVYTIIIYGLIGGNFVQLASYDLNIRQQVATPYPDFGSGLEALGNLFAAEWRLPIGYRISVANWDFLLFTGHPIHGDSTFIYAPVPSAQNPPQLPSLINVASGYIYDLLPLLVPSPVLKYQVVCPNGKILESAPVELKRPIRQDKQDANVSNNASAVVIDKRNGTVPTKYVAEFYIRVAIFAHPAEYSPLDQAMMRYVEDYDLNTVVDTYNVNGVVITITRLPFSGYNYTVNINKSGLPPGKYTVHVRTQFWWYDGSGTPEDYESFLYDFDVYPQEQPVGPPLPTDKCKVNTPAIRNEEWYYVRKAGDNWDRLSVILSTCDLDGYCGCFEFVQAIPEEWIDIVGYFRGSVKNAAIPNGAKHKARFRGRIVRLDDEYSVEDFVSSAYKQEDIVRAYAARYQIEIFAHTPCDLANIDILKMAEYWEITNRSNKMLPSMLYYLKPAEVSIADSGEHAKVTITLKELKWRDEYRRQG